MVISVTLDSYELKARAKQRAAELLVDNERQIEIIRKKQKEQEEEEGG